MYEICHSVKFHGPCFIMLGETLGNTFLQIAHLDEKLKLGLDSRNRTIESRTLRLSQVDEIHDGRDRYSPF